MSDALDQNPTNIPTNTAAVSEQVMQAQQTSSEKDQNWRMMRDRAESADRERQARLAAEQRAADLEKQLAAARSGGKLADDDLVEGKVWNRSMEEVNQLKNELALLAVQQEHQDFYSVVTDDMIQKVQETKPHLYQSILSNPNTKQRFKAMYDVAKQIKEAEKFSDQDKRIAENLSKPRNAATVGPQVSVSPLSNFGNDDRRTLSRADKEAVRDRVNRLLKRT